MKPSINNATPLTAAPGQVVLINGSGFSGTTAVKYGGYDALYFEVVSDTQIKSFVPLYGTGTISVTNPDGSATLAGFSQVLVKVKLPDLELLGRDVDPTDQIYVWDNATGKLKKANVSQLPLGDSTGGGGGGTVYTALGSPFKVRSFDETYSYDAVNNRVLITDLRIIGKSNYVVYSSDLNSEFEDYDAATNTGYLEYDEVNGVLTIHNFQLTSTGHITIYADGIVTTELQNYLISIKTKLLTYDKVIAPVIAQKGVVWPWRKSAIDIPSGWQECVDFRGKTLVGLSPTDNDFKTIDTIGGAKDVTMIADNLVEHDHDYRVVAFGGVSGDRLENDVLKRDDDIGLYLGRTLKTGKAGKASPTPMKVMNPYRIVQWIEYVG